MAITVGVDKVEIFPDEPDTKLFIVEGFTLKVELCENGDGDGWGIKYTTYVKGTGMTPSIWMGDTTIEDSEGVRNSPITKFFNEMTQEQAEAGFHQLLKFAGGAIRSFLRPDT